MAYIGPVARWDVFWADLEPAVGREQAGDHRPVVVVSNDEINAMLDVVTIVPLTKLEGKQRKLYPLDVKLPNTIIGNEWTPVAMPYQVRAISKLRLLEKIGQVPRGMHRERIEDALIAHLGIELDDD
jgi:mRNA interferase MazF